MAADVTVTEGVYSIAGQEALANDLAGIDPNAADDDGAMTDAGNVIDTGEGRWDADGHAIEPDVDPQQLAADRVRQEYETEQSARETAEWLEQNEAEQQQETFNDALANYAKLTPEEQWEVSVESVGRGFEAVAPIVNAEQAQALSSELFAGAADAVPACTTLAYFADNVMQTLRSAGITDTAQITPEVAQQITDPSMAALFAQSLCHALGMPELLEDGIVNPMEMSTALLPYVPVLLSGTSADLYPPEYKLAFAQDLCRAFGQKQLIRNIDPDAGVAQFDVWAKWGARLGAGLHAHRQQSSQKAQPTKSTRSSRRASRDDAFWGEGLKLYHERHAGI
jgi:hypothetical protein